MMLFKNEIQCLGKLFYELFFFYFFLLLIFYIWGKMCGWDGIGWVIFVILVILDNWACVFFCNFFEVVAPHYYFMK